MSGERTTKAGLLQHWLERRSYSGEQFSDLGSLVRRKRELGVSVSAVLPAREVAATAGAIVDRIGALNERAPLVDQVLVIDARSSDGTADVARSHGADVRFEDELLPELGPALGKGDAMWRALSVARGDVVLYLDTDTPDFHERFVYGVLGPLLTIPGVRFVKGSFTRPWVNGETVIADDGARVTELTAKPLFNLFYPGLGGFAQPLAGEFAAPRELLCSIPFLTGYAVETAMMIDVMEAVGIESMAQVDVGQRTNRHQSLFELGKMSYAVLRAVELRLRREGRLPDDGLANGERDSYVRALRSTAGLRLEHSRVEVLERPPMVDLLAGAGIV
jgi:glucosyl-3-phosphoglycerate synthase